jgi:hypothetical protein
MLMTWQHAPLVSSLTGARARNTIRHVTPPRAPRSAILALASLVGLAGCGARTELPTPPIDIVEPGPAPAYCNGKEDTAIYVVTETNQLQRFEPQAASFALIGDLACPVQKASATPFSMAVDHQGTAYVVFGDGELFVVDTATAACSAPSSPIDSSTFTRTFGSGFASDPGGLTETMYLASTASPGVLGTLATSTFVVEPIAPFSSNVGQAELTGTGSGRLFAFGVVQGLTGSHLAEVRPSDAVVLSDIIVPTPMNPVAWAFAFWGGDFYFFTSVDNATSTVGRFHPQDGSFDAAYATLPSGAITGAGVSTCAPR